MNISENRNYDSYSPIAPSRWNKKTFMMALAVLGCVAMIACVCYSRQSTAPQSSLVNLWERECYTCVKCKDDQI